MAFLSSQSALHGGDILVLFEEHPDERDLLRDAITAHTHQWYFDHYDTTYIPIDDETHLKTLYPVYKCSVSGCSAFDIRDGYESTPSHTMTSYSYTGSNYHAGNYHYIRYERHCVQCGHSTGYWDHYSCPGNGHCILPQSVFPVLTDK